MLFCNIDLLDENFALKRGQYVGVKDGKIEDAKTVVGALACDVMAHRLAADAIAVEDDGGAA